MTQQTFVNSVELDTMRAQLDVATAKLHKAERLNRLAERVTLAPWPPPPKITMLAVLFELNLVDSHGLDSVTLENLTLERLKALTGYSATATGGALSQLSDAGLVDRKVFTPVQNADGTYRRDSITTVHLERLSHMDAMPSLKVLARKVKDAERADANRQMAAIGKRLMTTPCPVCGTIGEWHLHCDSCESDWTAEQAADQDTDAGDQDYDGLVNASQAEYDTSNSVTNIVFSQKIGASPDVESTCSKIADATATEPDVKYTHSFSTREIHEYGTDTEKETTITPDSLSLSVNSEHVSRTDTTPDADYDADYVTWLAENHTAPERFAELDAQLTSRIGAAAATEPAVTTGADTIRRIAATEPNAKFGLACAPDCKRIDKDGQVCQKPGKVCHEYDWRNRPHTAAEAIAWLERGGNVAYLGRVLDVDAGLVNVLRETPVLAGTPHAWHKDATDRCKFIVQCDGLQNGRIEGVDASIEILSAGIVAGVHVGGETIAYTAGDSRIGRTAGELLEALRRAAGAPVEKAATAPATRKPAATTPARAYTMPVEILEWNNTYHRGEVDAEIAKCPQAKDGYFATRASDKHPSTRMLPDVSHSRGTPVYKDFGDNWTGDSLDLHCRITGADKRAVVAEAYREYAARHKVSTTATTPTPEQARAEKAEVDRRDRQAAYAARCVEVDAMKRADRAERAANFARMAIPA